MRYYMPLKSLAVFLFLSFRVERQLEDKLEFTVERIKQCQVT